MHRSHQREGATNAEAPPHRGWRGELDYRNSSPRARRRIGARAQLLTHFFVLARERRIFFAQPARHFAVDQIQIEFIPARVRVDLRKRQARRADSGANLLSGLSLPCLSSGIRCREFDSLRPEVLSYQARLTFVRAERARRSRAWYRLGRAAQNKGASTILHFSATVEAR